MPTSPLLPFSSTCIEALFIQRVKRFSIELEHNGERIWAHSNNSGSMSGLLTPGNPALISKATTPGRKLPYTLELLKADNVWVGVNTSAPNKMLAAAFAAGHFSWTAGYTTFKREVCCPTPYKDVRLDAMLTGSELPPLWIEAKSVTLRQGSDAAFPDAASERGRKHLKALMTLKSQGCRCACFYLVQRSDVAAFSPAANVDLAYAELFYEALRQGVEVYVYRAVITRQGIDLGELLPVNAEHYPPLGKIFWKCY
jgi:sugar fermentation stimulation protein A